jgi:threonyl-tRNA synthetase
MEDLAPNDHKRLGKELGLFVFSDTVGKGLPLFTPKGSVIRRELERFIVDEEIKRGYLHVYTPDIAKLELYKKSGHYPYYKESMYAPIQIEDEEFMLRPMTCPHHFELYLSHPHSYKELPMRIAELAKLYRFEQSGELMGLQRVRSFCLADAHIITQVDNADEEIDKVLDLIEFISDTFNLKQGKDYHYRLSLGNRDDKKKYFKNDAAWDRAEETLRSVLKKRKAHFIEAPDEAAFYGPKIDVQMQNTNGKEDTAFTVQYDFVMPERFNLTYINDKGEEERPIVIHRSSIGAIERVMAFLIEHYNGAFPAWLAPVQVAILPISDKFNAFAQKVLDSFKEAHIRVELDNSNNTLGNKIREATLQKVPYMCIIGGQEEEKSKDGKLMVTVRTRDGKDLGQLEVAGFITQIQKEIETKQ